MEMWCPDDIGRDSWDWVGPPAWERACFNSPEWGGGSSPVLHGASPDCIIVVAAAVAVAVVVVVVVAVAVAVAVESSFAKIVMFFEFDQVTVRRPDGEAQLDPHRPVGTGKCPA